MQFFGRIRRPYRSRGEPNHAITGECFRLVFLTTAEAEELYQSPKRIVDQQVRWETSSTTGAFNIEVRLELSDGTPLCIRGWYSPKSKRYGFALVFRGVWIRRWDDHRKNIAPKGGKPMNGPHKHKHNPSNPDRGELYATNDVTTDNVNRASVDFLKECNVDTTGLIYSGIL